MIRREFTRALPLLGLGPFLSFNSLAASNRKSKNESDREYWVNTMTKIATPVLESLSKGKLRKDMPVETGSDVRDRRKYTHLEAFGRLLAGMAPWIALGKDGTREGKQRSHFFDLALKSLEVGVDPKSPDFLNFNEGGQPVVDAAFLAHGILRAPALWDNSDQKTQSNLIEALKSSRVIKPGYNNWLLFSAMVEAFLLQFTGEYDPMRVDYAIRKHLEWYKGDGVYGDGEHFHWDYYNSYVIQPMMLDVLKVMISHHQGYERDYNLVLERARRYAAIQERLISPEGTFPAIGRSLPYRFGAFQLLGQIALMQQLPEGVTPAQVRSALTLVIKNMIEAKGTFDKDGWLQIGFVGHQPAIAESYISTGSLYLCSVGLLPLGLPPDHEFWTAPGAEWTEKKIWNGENVQNDHAIRD